MVIHAARPYTVSTTQNYSHNKAILKTQFFHTFAYTSVPESRLKIIT